MKSPIVLVKQQNLAVLLEFDGVLTGDIAKTPHNMLNNRIRHVIDSDGDLLSFTFVHTNHVGVRKLFSTLVYNISYDQYTYKKESNISVGRFREILELHQRDLDPDQSEMAIALFESVATCDSADPLRSHINLLNL
jgi:hypothetical protein